MRKLALLLVLTLPLFAAKFENIVVRNDETSFNDGGDAKDAGLGRHYASFEKDGVAYVITDEKMLSRILEELQPQIELGQEQARIGQEQARIGAEQAALGAQQAELGAQQAAAGNDRARMRELQLKQRRLQYKQEALAQQQRPLAEEQKVLAEKQQAEAGRAKKRLEALFDEALRSGVAKRR